MRRALLALAFLASYAGAATWTSHGPYGGSINALVASPSDSRLIVAGNAAGVFRSNDGGETWRDVSGGLRDVAFVAVDPRNAGVIYVIAGKRIYKTITGGAPWIDITGTLGGELRRPAGLLIDPQNPDTLYVGNGCVDVFKRAQPAFNDYAGILKSTDGGLTWTSVLNVLSLLVRCAEEIALDPAAPSHVYFASMYGGQSRTFNGGATWEIADVMPARDVVAHPSLVLTRYGIGNRVGRGAPAVLVSSDGGITWRETAGNGLPKFYRTFYDLAIDRGTGRLFLATSNGLFRSGDGGENWIPVGAPAAAITGVIFDEIDRRLVIATGRGIFHAPAPGAGTWTRADLHDLATNVVSLSDGIVATTADVSALAEPQGRVFRSLDFGLSWEELDVVRVSTGGGGASLLAVSPSKPNVVYRIGRLGDLISGLFVSEKSGQFDSWITLHYPGETESGGRVAVDPHNEKIVFVATAAGAVLRSNDGGRTWKSIGDGLPGLPILTIIVDPLGLYLHAGLQNGGVWELPLATPPGRGRAVRR